jgi:threonine/homoserine/homoserine lactone efflux protein
VEIAFIASAIGLGIAYAATPGVVNTECVRRGLTHGFRPAISVQAGALLGDVLWAALALSGIAAFAANATVEIALSLLGGAFLVKLAFAAIRSALNGPSDATGASSGGHLRTGLVFGLANPAGLAFWAGVGGGVLATRSGSADFADYASFLLAFLFGALVWSASLSAMVSWGRRYARPKLFRALDAACAAVLGFFGVRLLWTGTRRLLKVV